MDRISHSMGYRDGGGGLQKGGEHAYTHFCKVKWHYIKSSISICGLLLLLWVWQHRGREADQKMGCALQLKWETRTFCDLWCLLLRENKNCSHSYWAVSKLVCIRYKATIYFWSSDLPYWLIRHIIKHHQLHEHRVIILFFAQIPCPVEQL